MIPIARPTSPRFVFIMAFVISIGSVGCKHPLPDSVTPAQSDGDVCVSMAALLHGANHSHCTTAQRLCLLVGDIPAALTQEDFIPEASYRAHWSPHVLVWRTQLGELGKTPELEPYAHAVQRKIELLSRNENDRRLTIVGGDLMHVLQILGKKTAAVVPSPGLGCTLPQ